MSTDAISSILSQIRAHEMRTGALRADAAPSNAIDVGGAGQARAPGFAQALSNAIGKGNEVGQFPLFGLEIDDQWELLADKYALLRRLWRETDVDWDATPYTRAQHATTTLPRPFAGAPRVWHGAV